jgi:transmembrane sensor
MLYNLNWMNSYHQLEELLANKSFKDWVLKGDSSQQAYWEEWQAGHPDRVELLLQAKTILLELDSTHQTWEDREQQLLFSKITQRIDSKGRPTARRHYPAYRSYSVGIAKKVKAVMAVFSLLAAMTVLLPYFGKDADEEALVGNEKNEAWILKSNPIGQKSTIQLADGSKVVLNADSELKFEGNFGQDHRDIYLKGEAFFEVAPDSLLPFRVYSGESVTMALGTSFNINSYNNKKVQIQLATGKVKVIHEDNEDESVYLNPGEEVVVDANRKLTKSKFDPDKAFLWKNGVLRFDKATLQTAVSDLERWYGVEIEVFNRPEREIRMSGEFKNSNLADVLESLGYAYSFDYSIDNKNVSIYFKPKKELMIE